MDPAEKGGGWGGTRTHRAREIRVGQLGTRWGRKRRDAQEQLQGGDAGGETLQSSWRPAVDRL